MTRRIWKLLSRIHDRFSIGRIASQLSSLSSVSKTSSIEKSVISITILARTSWSSAEKEEVWVGRYSRGNGWQTRHDRLRASGWSCNVFYPKLSSFRWPRIPERRKTSRVREREREESFSVARCTSVAPCGHAPAIDPRGRPSYTDGNTGQRENRDILFRRMLDETSTPAGKSTAKSVVCREKRKRG